MTKTTKGQGPFLSFSRLRRFRPLRRWSLGPFVVLTLCLYRALVIKSFLQNFLLGKWPTVVRPYPFRVLQPHQRLRCF